MTADDPVYWAVLRIEEGDHLYVDGEEMRTPEEVVVFEARVKRWTEEVARGIEHRSPRDVATFRTLGRRPVVRMPVGHPYWTLPQVFVTHNTSSSECVESNPLSRLHGHIESLKEIADRWRANPPMPTKPAKVAEPAPSVVRPNRRGRRKGTVGYDSTDIPLIEKMNRFIESGDATSPWSAALLVVDDAKGKGSAENKIKRLTGKYIKKYGPGEGHSV